MRILKNISINIRLLFSFLVVGLFVIGIAVLGFFNMRTINDGMTSMYEDQTLPIEYLSQVEKNLYSLRGNALYLVLFPEDVKIALPNIEKDFANIEEGIQNYAATSLDTEEEELLRSLEETWPVYKDGIKEIAANVQAGKTQKALALIQDEHLIDLRQVIDSAAADLMEIAVKNAKATNVAGDQTFQSSIQVYAGLCVVALILAITIGLSLSRSIIMPLRQVIQTSVQVVETDLRSLVEEMDALAKGDLTRSFKIETPPVPIDQKDEVGQLAYEFNALITGLQEIGRSFMEMTDSLQILISEVARESVELSASSNQLAASAEQSAGASAQIAATIQQVANGIAQQTDSVNRTASVMEQSNRAIDGVARGAQEQAAAVAKASELTAKINGLLRGVVGKAENGAHDAEQAIQAANTSARQVGETIQGWDVIRSKVALSAEKVQEMGEHSGQIGLIIETIDDIASQTNLLALNAAIEAARAGEHGKGFSVVADEVRKLAEKSAAATKEIAHLIKDIQVTVAEAITAMEEGSQEVETGVAKAGEAGTALKEIMEVIARITDQIGEIANDLQEMDSSAGEVGEAMESVSAIVEENTAATEEMAAGSNEIIQSIENIASVSEENSAAVEEVSASSEEMNAQVEEATAAAQSLADMAEELQQLVARFKIDEESAPVKLEEKTTPANDGHKQEKINRQTSGSGIS